ncbi:hypothetical protein PABG_00049 [Paracoccidioides brasiliensis Pb03]|uniref:Uncharacterized protein n=1 Tax=Paracoccidioides brasiliensis (strain Pb18) TaxID=502780 RepID=C1G5I5_PARBD|nr:uncharacterized protein PADG_02440 [Paracoccidioides brasiliensis Pb18]EEH17486.1 hypothetical protein PABG_00049 [Paracoccidioides brasiliensis Pb03]EEH46342.1 hypothetical protein PADG_02440 [Paracoccidioides brasiliensis Pb18]ODH52501.1 hypothetical protein GX48_01281 [Paracoccidioides brasiliensis]
MQRIDDRLTRHDLKLSSSEALLSRRYRRSITEGMDPSELSIVTVQLSAFEGKQVPSRSGSPQTTTIRFADSLPIRRPDKQRTRLENPYAPPAHHHNQHPHVQSMIVRKSRSFVPVSNPTSPSSKIMTPSSSGSPKPLTPYSQEPTKVRTDQMSRLNKPTPALPAASNSSSSTSSARSASNSSRNSSTSTQQTELLITTEMPSEPSTMKPNAPVPTPEGNRPASQKQPRLKKNLIPPLTKVHFSCYQSHRYFAASNNSVYPVPCMACLKEDQLLRWRCTFCCLRICRECMQTIQKCKRRSLKELMDCLVRALEAAGGA